MTSLTFLSSRKWRFMFVLLVVVCFVFSNSVTAFAKKANPPSPKGGAGMGHRKAIGNPPGPAGGSGAGPLWKDNLNKIDNPPGPKGGRGTDFPENPSSAAGGSGASPYAKDKPLSPVGGPAADPYWKNPPGPIGGPGVGPVKNKEQYQEWVEKHQEKAERWEERKGALPKKTDLNQDGTIDKKEKMIAQEKWAASQPPWPHKDLDNNPPGMAGGAGTNWENLPGPKGGHGTDWGNLPGPSVSPSASPEQKVGAGGGGSMPSGIIGDSGKNPKISPPGIQEAMEKYAADGGAKKIRGPAKAVKAKKKIR